VGVWEMCFAAFILSSIIRCKNNERMMHPPFLPSSSRPAARAGVQEGAWELWAAAYLRGSLRRKSFGLGCIRCPPLLSLYQTGSENSHTYPSE
jgi:hypothetical protein